MSETFKPQVVIKFNVTQFNGSEILPYRINAILPYRIKAKRYMRPGNTRSNFFLYTGTY